MAFTIRIELHNANAGHYLDLAKRLAAVSITDMIRGDNGSIYKLPPAEYNSDSNEAIETIRQRCAGIAASVVPSYAVLVTKGDQRAWQGLQVVR
jgi:hypothetical protein